MKVHVVYRSAPGENRKERPPFYSKLASLDSFLGAAQALPDGERIFVSDGTPRPEFAERFAPVATRTVELSGIGNARSYRACVGIVEASDWADDDYVYFAEDDYLYVPEAFERLMEAVAAGPADAYYTLYDHPDYRSRWRHQLYMRRNTHRFEAGGIGWRSVKATCLTYLAPVGMLRHDAWAHHLHSRVSPPGDYAIWTTLTGGDPAYALSSLLRRWPRLAAPEVLLHPPDLGSTPRRKMYAPLPSLATHLEYPLAPGRDWDQVAAARDATAAA